MVATYRAQSRTRSKGLERDRDLIGGISWLAIDGERLFNAVQATWNLLESSAAPALQTAHDAGLGAIVKESLADGRLRSDHGIKRGYTKAQALVGGLCVGGLAFA